MLYRNWLSLRGALYLAALSSPFTFITLPCSCQRTTIIKPFRSYKDPRKLEVVGWLSWMQCKEAEHSVMCNSFKPLVISGSTFHGLSGPQLPFLYNNGEEMQDEEDATEAEQKWMLSRSKYIDQVVLISRVGSKPFHQRPHHSHLPSPLRTPLFQTWT